MSEQDVLLAIEEAKASSKDDMVATLTAGSPVEVLGSVRKMYDRGIEIETTGVGQKEMVRQLRGEFPNLEEYYWLLRKQSWGYRLGQMVFAQKMLDEEEKTYGPQTES